MSNSNIAFIGLLVVLALIVLNGVLKLILLVLKGKRKEKRA